MEEKKIEKRSTRSFLIYLFLPETLVLGFLISIYFENVKRVV